MKKNLKMKKWQIASALVVGAVVVVAGVVVGSGVGTQGMLIRGVGTPVSKNTVALKGKMTKGLLATKGELSKGEFSNLLVKALKVDISKNTGCAEDLKGSNYEQSACYLVKNKIMELDVNGRFNSGEMVSKKEFSDKMVKVFKDPQCPWCSINNNNKGLMKEMETYATSKLSNSSTAIGSEQASIIIGSVINGLDSKGVKVCCLSK